MSNYDCGAGLDQQFLNQVSKELYDACYPTFFSGKVNVGKFEIADVKWDITQAPVFNLNPSEKAISALKDAVSAELDDMDLVSQLHSYIEDEAITFELSVPAFKVTVETEIGEISPSIQGSIDVYCQAEITVENKLVGSIIKAEINIEGKPILQLILNKVVLPIVEKHLNKTLLKGIELPNLSFEGITLSTPAAFLENQTLVAVSALSGVTGPPTMGSPWPKDKLFCLGDSAFIETAAGEALKSLHKSGSTGESIGTLYFSAGYNIGISNPRVELRSGNQFSLSVDAYSSGTFKAGLKYTPFQFSQTITFRASPKITAAISVAASNQVIVTFLSVDDFKVEIDISGIPSWLNKFMSEILSFLTKNISNIIGSMLTGFKFNVFKIPQIEINEEDLHLIIEMSDIGVTTMVDSGNKKLALVSGDVEVKKAA
ncbi:MAG: hypothetical protein JSV88_31250 [Candidatus Aminicenantes bacterium]|nr:MAG: hypothetical protein JSV88_31250 [Candidatus Aminicenantes bacterium]